MLSPPEPSLQGLLWMCQAVPKGCTPLTQALLLVPTGLSDLLQLLVLDGQGSLPILQPGAQGQVHPGLGAV